MDKAKVRELQVEIKKCIEEKNFDSAKKYYELQLSEMSDEFNSYNCC